MEIIILIAVIGFIGNIINAMNKNKQGQQGQPGQPNQHPVRKIFEELRDEFTPAEMRAPIPKSRQYTEPQINDSEPVGRMGTSYTVVNSNFSETADSLQVESIEDGFKKKHTLNLSEDNLINGVILAEILSPPKSLRR